VTYATAPPGQALKRRTSAKKDNIYIAP